MAFFLFFLFQIFNSCNKDDELIVNRNNPTIPIETYTSLDEFIQSKKPRPETFEITAELGGTYTTRKGSIITIPANGFKTISGQSVTGPVEIRMIEVFSTAEMIFSGIFPISDNRALNSRGEFFIQAKQNGSSLGVAEGSFIKVDISAAPSTDYMDVFLGGPTEETENMNWSIVDSMINIVSFSGVGFESTDNRYKVRLDTMGWINVDAFDSTVSYYDCSFNLTGLSGLDSFNTSAYAVFKAMNAVMPIGKYNGKIANNIITETNLADVPINLVVISVLNDKLHYGILDLTAQQGSTYSIEMNETTSAELDMLLGNLP